MKAEASAWDGAAANEQPGAQHGGRPLIDSVRQRNIKQRLHRVGRQNEQHRPIPLNAQRAFSFFVRPVHAFDTAILLELDLLFDKLFRIYPSAKSSTPITYDLTPILRIMMNILKVPWIAGVRLVLDPFSKLLTFILQNGTFQLEHIIELCSLSNRTFTRVRSETKTSTGFDVLL